MKSHEPQLTKHNDLVTNKKETDSTAITHKTTANNGKELKKLTNTCSISTNNTSSASIDSVAAPLQYVLSPPVRMHIIAPPPKNDPR